MDKEIIIHTLIMHKGKVLILKRVENTYEGGLWDLPGGTLEDGEDLSDGAKREAFEESGLKVENLEIFYYSSNVDIKKNKQFITIIFINKLDSDTAKVIINQKEHSESKWIAPQDIKQYPTVSYLKSCIEYLINKKHHLDSNK
jgi:8-oxo-dGTP diphosphatase